MRLGIEKIINLVAVITGSARLTAYDLPELDPTTLSNQILIEVENIRKELIRSIFETSRQTEVEFLVQNCQGILIKLLDELFEAKKLKSISTEFELTTDIICSAFSGLLFFIEKFFTRYFSINEKVPEVYYSININEINRQYETLKIKLEAEKVKPELLKILGGAFKESNSTQKREIVTFRQLIYVKELLNEITFVINSCHDDLNILIPNLLIYLNYNHPSFINFLVESISSKINSTENRDEKIIALRFQKKEIKQVACRPGVGFHVGLMDAKEQIISWIDEEVNYLLNETNKLNLSTSEKEEGVSELRISTSLSVPQLALLIRLFVENKIITNSNQTEILKFFSANFSTIKRENISYTHLRSQYYKPELSAVEAVKNLLLQLVNLTRKVK